MLKQIRLQNYRCYEDHIIYFHEMTIAIGRNNAGKSTLVEAIRLLSLASSRYRNSTYREPPEWTGLSKAYKMIKPSLSSIELDLDNEAVFYRRSSPPAVISALFDNNSQIKVYIGSNEEVYALMINSDGSVVTNKSQAYHSDIPPIYVLPQITPLIRNERRIRDDTIKYNMSSKRMSANFRNQLFLHRNSPLFEKFKTTVETTCQGIRVADLFEENNELFVFIRDNDYTDEVYVMGHGIQMWLQCIWFLSRIEHDSIIVLDEPDVYMHPDLQRKLIRMINHSYAQTIIATHSIEIISEVEPKDILIIDRDKKESVFVDSIPALQVVLNSIGSVHNIALSRLDKYKKYLYVEGQDLDILRYFYNTLFPESNLPIDNIPCAATGGWGSWDVKSKDAERLLNIESSYNTYFIYDRDYHTEEEISSRKTIANSKNLNICIWNKKEIENYLLVETAITRLVSDNTIDIEKSSLPTVEAVHTILDEICEELKEQTYGNIFDEIYKKNRKLNYARLKAIVDLKFVPLWNTFDGKLSLVSGKEVVSRLSEKCQRLYGISFGTSALAATLKQNEIHTDIKKILSAIENNQKFRQ